METYIAYEVNPLKHTKICECATHIWGQECKNHGYTDCTVVTDVWDRGAVDAALAVANTASLGSAASTGDTDADSHTANVEKPTNDTSTETNDTSTKTNDTSTKSNDTSTKTNNTSTKTNDTSTKTNNTSTKTNDTSTKTNNTAPQLEAREPIAPMPITPIISKPETYYADWCSPELNPDLPSRKKQCDIRHQACQHVSYASTPCRFS
ncbi:hypothetical protein SLS59_010014 [Nothophoma quercina]|uniref:Uncharacterized protein n=1 Tax=Nothophoma quercina TaxID=749835 RepID=A0ABR3QIA8_9PLEO